MHTTPRSWIANPSPRAPRVKRSQTPTSTYTYSIMSMPMETSLNPHGIVGIYANPGSRSVPILP